MEGSARPGGPPIHDDRLDAYSTVEHDLLRDAVPRTVFMAVSDRTAARPRVGCYRRRPLYGTEYGALCLS